MCGIVGAFGQNVDVAELESTLVHLHKRGPDHSGFKSFSGICHMGVARLAMTDPNPRSNQPLSIEKDLYSISFNGEIFNYKSIKDELSSKGVLFNTESDTEVIAKLIAYEGVSAIDSLEGMFAFAFYDSRNNRLVLARDKLGKKPLYYTFINNVFYWSSSLEILNSLSPRKENNIWSDVDYLTLGYRLDPNTGYQGIFALMPGHYIEIESDHTFPQPKRFGRENQILRKECSLRDSLKRAVVVRTEGHESIALSLSGGIDSTIIALILNDLGVKAQAFSAFWSDSDKTRYNSDKNHAKEISQSLGHEFTEVDISSDFNLKNQLHEYLKAMEEPNNNPTGLSTLSLYENVSQKGFKLLLTGDGSDEIFGGYRRYVAASRIPQFLYLNEKHVEKYIFSYKTNFQRKVANFLVNQIDPQDPLRWLNWHWVFTPDELQDITNAQCIRQNTSKIMRNYVSNLSPSLPESSPVESLMRRDHQIWLSMESNRKLDRISMAYSIEARSPFQDENVINIASKLMNQFKYKELDKVLLKKQFPELMDLPVKNEKVGFTSPIGHWMRNEPEFIKESLDFLKTLPGWNTKGLQRYYGAQFKGDYRTNMQLWTLVVYANWLILAHDE